MKKNNVQIDYQKELSRVVKQLKAYRPLKIILFGSVARGQSGKESDIDLLIIKETKKPFHRRIREVLDLTDSVKVEPLVFTPEEINQRLAIKDFFIQRVLKEGQLIYEAQV